MTSLYAKYLQRAADRFAEWEAVKAAPEADLFGGIHAALDADDCAPDAEARQWMRGIDERHARLCANASDQLRRDGHDALAHSAKLRRVQRELEAEGQS